MICLFPAPEGMPPAAAKTAAVTVLMAIWWITEAVPIPATSLLPIVLYPVLGIMDAKAVTRPYANHLIYLFMGGFFIAVTMERWNLHKRIAMNTLRIFGSSAVYMVLGFMTATAFLSMWISNTATAALLVPVMAGTAVAMKIHPFGPAVAACIAASYAFMLPVATPPNAVVFGSGQVTIAEMVKAGIWLNIIGTVLITASVMVLMPYFWEIDLSVIPEWAVNYLLN